MKKFLLSILICAGTINTTHTMEQSWDLERVVRTCPNQIVGHLDGQTLSSLSQVSSILQAICDAVPTKYLTIFFSDVAEYGNIKLINRFISQPDSWMFEPATDAEPIAFQEGDENNTAKPLMYLFSQELRNFFGPHSALSLNQGNKAARYLLKWKNSWTSYIIYFNVDKCEDTLNDALTKGLSPVEVSLINKTHMLDFINEKAHGGYLWETADHQFKRHDFSISNSSYSAESLRNQFGFISIFILAAQKNHTGVVYAILNNPTILDSWSSEILEIALYLNNGNEIKDVVWATLFERNAKTKDTK